MYGYAEVDWTGLVFFLFIFSFFVLFDSIYLQHTSYNLLSIDNHHDSYRMANTDRVNYKPIYITKDIHIYTYRNIKASQPEGISSITQDI